MAVLRLPKRRDPGFRLPGVKSADPVRVDLSNHSARGLVGAFDCRNPDRLVNLAAVPLPTTLAGSPAVAEYPEGSGVRYPSTVAAECGLSAPIETGKFSFLAIMSNESTGGDVGFLSLSNSGATSGRYIFYQKSTGTEYTYFTQDLLNYLTFAVSTSDAPANSGLHTHIGRVESGYSEHFIDGISQATPATDAFTLNSSLNQINLHSYQDLSGGRNGTAGYLLVYVWDRILTDAEVIEFSLDPYQLLRPVNQPRLFIADAGGGGGSFVAAWAKNANTIIQGGM